MQHDDLIWQVIKNQFCSFKTTMRSSQLKAENKQFCRHEYSVTGLCNRTSCPLANSKYAVLRESEGRLNLFIKSVERAHSPKNLWERISLSRNYGRAMEQLDEHLAYFPKNIVHRNKQRLTKIHQYLIRMRKIELKVRDGKKQKLVRTHRKVEQREERREYKALVAAKVERNIEKELLERLSSGAYGDIYNYPEVPYQRALRAAVGNTEDESEEEVESEDEKQIEYVEDLEDADSVEDVEDMEYFGSGKWGATGNEESSSDEESDDDEEQEKDDDSEEDSDLEEDGKRKKRSAKSGFDKKRQRGMRVEIQYEEENEQPQMLQQESTNVLSSW